MTFETDIAIHAEEQYPKESCGLLIAQGAKIVYVPCENKAISTEEHFKISGEDWSKAEDLGQVIAVVHSHPDESPFPSEGDLVSCELHGVPWYIQEVVGGVSQRLHRFEPTGYKAPLLGREFFHGVLDCLTLLQDYYAREMGITLPNYDREDGWWDLGKDYYRELLPKSGFYEVTDLRQGDIVLMQIRSPVPNHAGIYLADGKLTSEECYPQPGVILHHLYGRLSKRDNYGGYWADVTVGYWRYQDDGQTSKNPAVWSTGR